MYEQWQRAKLRPRFGRVRYGPLRRLRPVSSIFGFDRGPPIDRYYIEAFLSRYTVDIHGRVLEIADSTYTRKFGGDRVVRGDVLPVTVGNPEATIVADLTRADEIPSNMFDCIILTQTLTFIYDMSAAIRTLYRILKPSGVLLATFHGISKISRYDMNHWGNIGASQADLHQSCSGRSFL